MIDFNFLFLSPENLPKWSCPVSEEQNLSYFKYVQRWSKQISKILDLGPMGAII